MRNKEYKRLDEKTKEKNKVEDFIKNLILIKNKYNKDDISECMLQQLIL